MTQLVELQQGYKSFEENNIRLYVVSYDSIDALNEFKNSYGIQYPLLADEKSEVIDAYGIRNFHVRPDEVPYYGIPFPGTYLVDEEGIVTEKFFYRNAAQRRSAERMVDSALGQLLIGEAAAVESTNANDVNIQAWLRGGDGTLKVGLLRDLVIRFTLPEGLHMYDSPVPTGMKAINIEVQSSEGVHIGELEKPNSKDLEVSFAETSLRVWSGQVDFRLPVFVNGSVVSVVHGAMKDDVEFAITLSYQTCSKETCMIPTSQEITLTVPVSLSEGPAVGGKLGGTKVTAMNSKKHLRRLVFRGLILNPVKGLYYLIGLIKNTWR